MSILKMVILPRKGLKRSGKLPRGWQFITRHLFLVILLLLFQGELYPQCPSVRQCYNQLVLIEKDIQLSTAEKLAGVEQIQNTFYRCGLNKDSVYAQLLHRQGVLQFSTGKLNEAIANTLSSIKINMSGKKEASKKLAVKSYYNLGYYYTGLSRLQDALTYYSLCIETGSYYTDSLTLITVINARNRKAYIYYQTGDYQKVIEEAALGLKTAAFIKNGAITPDLFIVQAEAFAALRQIEAATTAINKAFLLIGKDDYEALANNYKIKASISEAADNYAEAIAYHKRVISLRGKAGDPAALATDYLDAGNTVRKEAIHNNTQDYSKAIRYYTLAAELSAKAGDHVTAVKASNNLAAISFRLQDYSLALTRYHNSLLQEVTAFNNTDVLSEPAFRQCNAVSDKNFLSILLSNKAECLLYLFKQTKNKQYLTATLATALLTDSVITDMRNQQLSEQSKLYWRNETRDFFSMAIEACYQAGDKRMAFYFMEKSRAVLLNDRLNELGVAANLPPAEAAREQSFQINVFACQQQLAELSAADPAYEEQQAKFFEAKEILSRYIKTIEQKYPRYYQYKYASAVPTLIELQKHVTQTKQAFVHYFINDTVIYILAIAPSSTTFIKQSKKNTNTSLAHFLEMCADIRRLNNYYSQFALQAFSLYQTLFKPLALPNGRVTICSDGLIIPFEALTTDPAGNNFLINNYEFSYVYSASFLLRKFKIPPARSDFLGVAPASYAAYLSLPSLKNSTISVNESSSYYSSSTVLVNKEASRRNLISQLPFYTIVVILSHARADSTDSEPLLFLADSVVKLSEIQLLQNPSTELIVLSACQTNVGKLAAGEGIFSLARGFASAGIPSITGTLWKADEETIYIITQNFLKNISKGMRKDEALKKAKLSFLQNGSRKNLLPYFWANMILIGNGEPVILNRHHDKLWWLAGAILLIAAGWFTFVFFKNKRRLPG